MSVAGMGWCSRAIASEAVDFVRRSVRESGATALTCLAVPHFRQGEAFPGTVAALLDVPLLWVAEDALQAVQSACLTVSEKALQEKGVAAVAEGCALAAAGHGAWLRMPRQTHAGVTCAVAEREDMR